MSNYPERRPVARRRVVQRKTGVEWLPIVIVILLIVIAGVVIWILLSDNNDVPVAMTLSIALLALPPPRTLGWLSGTGGNNGIPREPSASPQ